MFFFVKLRRKIRQHYLFLIYCLIWSVTLGLLAHHTRKYVIYKYVLIWSDFDYNELEVPCDFYNTKNCAYNNCFFTRNRSYFGEDLYKFDAVLFNGHNLKSVPRKRYSNQKYVFVSKKPSLYKPLCSHFFANFFNWTWTFKPHSDILATQVRITGPLGHKMSGRNGINHINPRGKLDADLIENIKTKSKEIAWIDKQCENNNEIKVEFIEQLKNSLTNYAIEIEYFEVCANKNQICDETHNYGFEKDILKDFHFAIAVDETTEIGNCNYLTENVMLALENYAVPIILGDNDDCLPPKSYLNLEREGPEAIAYKINLAVRDREIFEEYFQWKNNYNYKRSESDFCLLCEKLNDNAEIEAEKYIENFGFWWNKRGDC